MAKMSIDIPIVAATLLCKQSHFYVICDSLNVSVYLIVDLLMMPIPKIHLRLVLRPIRESRIGFRLNVRFSNWPQNN